MVINIENIGGLRILITYFPENFQTEAILQVNLSYIAKSHIVPRNAVNRY